MRFVSAISHSDREITVIEDDHRRAGQSKPSAAEAVQTWLEAEVAMAKAVAERLRTGFRRPDSPTTEPITVPLFAAFPTSETTR